ncbi:hypothetical protein DIPPA_28681 [Diplonema papillatum]|nr:hypothetical protein DIPPA_28681 [Diplonema papillatum]KAJ9450990.1 hypothetical protein DIPPA_28681 [Diplonema papillatum]
MQAKRAAGGFSFLSDQITDPELIKERKVRMKDLNKIPDLFKTDGAGRGAGPAGVGLTSEQDKKSYMRSKDSKFGVEEPRVNISEQAADNKQQAARDIALNSNPFSGQSQSPVSSFMNYVEVEQDYFQRSQQPQESMMMARDRAKRAAMQKQAAVRTTEMLGAESINTLRSANGQYQMNPLLISQFDMNTFTLSNGVRVVGSFLMFRSTYFLWDVACAEDITMEKLMPIAHMFPVPKFIILGTGSQVEPIHPDIHMYLRSRGTRLDICTTPIAISQYHQVRTDNYPCCAAFLPLEPTNGYDYYEYNKFWKHRRDVAHAKEQAVRPS